MGFRPPIKACDSPFGDDYEEHLFVTSKMGETLKDVK